MLKKITLNNVMVLLLLSVFVLSCVDEPFIEPVKTPYSLIRVGNFTNSNSIDVVINNDRNDKSVVITKTIGQNGLSDYFKVTSGNRVFTVTNDAGKIIYTNPISVISYAQETIVFGGKYIDDDNNSVNFKTYTEGKVYLPDLNPPEDSSIVYFVNLISSTSDTISANADFRVLASDSLQTVVDTTSSLSTFDKQGLLIGQGTYNLVAKSDFVADTVELPISSGLIYYVFASGDPDNFVVLNNSQSPLPPQDK